MSAEICFVGTPKKPSAPAADIKANDPDQPSVTGLQADIALDGQLQQYVSAPQGLFPAPIAPHLVTGQSSKVLGYFKLMGRAMAKALQVCQCVSASTVIVMLLLPTLLATRKAMPTVVREKADVSTWAFLLILPRSSLFESIC